MRNLTNTGIEVIVNQISAGDAISIGDLTTSQSINVDINKAPITTTTAATDQYLLQDGNNNIKKILYSDLIGSSGSGLTAGEALSITGSTIDLSISKQSSITTSADTDLYVLEDNAGNIKKITRGNLLAGFINTNWTLNSGVLYPLATATNVAIGTTTMNGSEKLRINGNSEFDGKITINGSNVLEASALSGSYNFNIQNTNFTNSGTLNLMGVNSVGATNLLTITNDSTLPKMNFPSGIWTNGNATNITETELFYLDGVSSNIQTQLNSLSSSVSTNTTNISTNQNSITSLTSSVSTNSSDISSLQAQQTSNTNAINVNTGNISTNTGSISSLQGQQNSNTLQISTNTSNISSNSGNISTNSTAISDIKSKYDFTGSVANGKLLIGNSSNYSVGELLSSDNSVTITKSAGGIDLVVPSSSSLSSGTGINITNSFINYDINKETAYTTPSSADTMLLYSSVGNATKKITFQDFNAGLQTQITNNDNDITSLNSSVSTNTTGITNIKNKYDFSTTVLDGKLLIGSTSTGNYSSAYLTSTGNTITITNGSNSINLESNHTNLSAGVAIAINSGNIDLDIQKENAFTSPVGNDLLVMYDTTNSAMKKITFNNFNAGLQAQITSNDSDITSLNSSVSTNTTGITNIKNKYDFSTTVLDGKLLIGSTSTGNYSSALLTSTGGTLTITNGSNSINLESNHTSLSAGVGIALNANAIDLDINKPNSFTSPVSADLLVMYDTTNSLTKKITFSDFNAGLQAQITSNDNDITSLNSSVSTNTSNIALNTAAISNLVSTANSTNFGTTASSAITVGNNSQSLALNSASMNCISAGKNFFRSNLSSGLSYQIQAYNQSSYFSVFEVHNVSSGFPYLNLFMGNGFSINQYTGQSRNLIVDTNGKLNISNDMPITLTAGDGIALNSNSINVDISKQVAITNPASDDTLLIERSTGVINKIAYSDLGIGVVAGNAIAVSSGTTVNVEISKENTITSPASGDLLLLEQASDGVLKNITYNNLISGVDVTTATSIATAATGAITVGNAGNQTLNVVGSTINITGNNKIKNRSTISTGTGFEIEGYNSADSIYYSSLKLDNSNQAGVRPTIEILGASGFYGSAGQFLLKDSNGKLDWGQGTTANPIQYVADTPAVIALTASSLDGSVAISASPRKLWLKSTVNNNAIWSSIDFIETATTLTSATGQINNTGTTYTFTSSGVGITLLNQNDTFNITVIVEDDYAPLITYPVDSSALSTTNKGVSTNGTTHTFTAQINNLLSSSGSQAYNIVLSDYNTATIINLQTIQFTLNVSYSAPSFTSTSRTLLSAQSSYFDSSSSQTLSNAWGQIFNDRGYSYANIKAPDTGGNTNPAWTNAVTMFNDGKAAQGDSFFGSYTWNFQINSDLNFLFHSTASSTSAPSAWTAGGVSQTWTQVPVNTGPGNDWLGYGNAATVYRSTNALPKNTAISATTIARGVLWVSIKEN